MDPFRGDRSWTGYGGDGGGRPAIRKGRAQSGRSEMLLTYRTCPHVCRAEMLEASVNSQASGTLMTPERLVFSQLRPLPSATLSFPFGAGL